MGIGNNLSKATVDDLEYFYVQSLNELPDFVSLHRDVISVLDEEPLLLITRGKKSTGGYVLEVLDTGIDNDNLIVELHSSDPKPGSMSIMMVTYPYVYVKTGQAKSYSVVVNGKMIVKERSL